MCVALGHVASGLYFSLFLLCAAAVLLWGSLARGGAGGAGRVARTCVISLAMGFPAAVIVVRLYGWQKYRLSHWGLFRWRSGCTG